jgi:hypothetical protein
VRESLGALKPSVDEIEYDRDGVMRRAKREQGDQVRRVVDKLREEWSQVNRGYTERHKYVPQKSLITELHEKFN